jgi:hypothetical protein
MLQLLLLLALPLLAHTGDGEKHDHTVKEPSLWINLRLGMPEQMETALEKWDSNFSIIALSQLNDDIRQAYSFTMRKAPSVVIGDFNGDKVKDVALLGWSNGHLRLIAVISAPGRYDVVELKKWRIAFPRGPELLKRLGLAAETTSIQLLDGDAEPISFQWKNGKFNEI